ncbi:MAG: sulfotransferase [Flavobacteriales bacterium]|nr:sulfotransferase [Flavobacteriales bacterium]
MNQQPIFILGAHKSGTTLLRNLLSGHPDLFVVPFESHFFPLSDKDVDYEYRKNKRQGLSVKEIEANFHKNIQFQNEAIDPMGDTFVAGKLDSQKFNETFKLNSEDSPSIRFEKYMNSIHECLGFGSLPENKRVVEKSVENAEFAVELSKMFPEARFIHIVRNPYANFVSLRKYKSIGVGYPLLNRMMKTFKNSFYFLSENPKNIRHYKVVRYEDILSETEPIMRQIAEFLSIDFTETLLQPSHLGENWSGNSTTGKGFSGVSAANIDKWKNEIQPVEVKCVNSVSSQVLADYHYEKIESETGSWTRCEGESLKRYIYNRLTTF